MYCKNCGKELPDESLFCGYCGAELEETGPAAGFAREQAAKIKEKAPTVTKADFIPMAEMLKNPFEEKPAGKYDTIISAVITFLGCWVCFGFRYGLLAALISWTSTMIILYVAEKEAFNFTKAISQAAQVLFVPAVFTILSGIFAVFGMNPFVIMLRLFLLGAAVMVYVYALETYTFRMGKWGKALLMAAVFAILAACALSSLSEAAVNTFIPY